MSNLQRKKSNQGKEMFYMNAKGERDDKGLHDELLAGHPGPHYSSIVFARQCGLTEKEIVLLYGEDYPKNDDND